MTMMMPNFGPKWRDLRELSLRNWLYSLWRAYYVCFAPLSLCELLSPFRNTKKMWRRHLPPLLVILLLQKFRKRTGVTTHLVINTKKKVAQNDGEYLCEVCEGPCVHLPVHLRYSDKLSDDKNQRKQEHKDSLDKVSQL